MSLYLHIYSDHVLSSALWFALVQILVGSLMLMSRIPIQVTSFVAFLYVSYNKLLSKQKRAKLS